MNPLKVLMPLKHSLPALLLGVSVQAQVPTAASGASLTFTLDRTGPAAVHYSVQLDEATGKGVYRGAALAAGLLSAGTSVARGDAVLPIAVPEAVLKKVFAAGPLVRSNRCDAHRKGIAQTGTKTLRLAVADGASFECSYNYAEDERVNAATAALEAVAETMQYGERLRAKLRFDRLGLDAEMEALRSALADGRALGVSNIAPVLEAIQNDDRVMERVRRAAAHLLERAGLPSPDAADGPRN